MAVCATTLQAMDQQKEAAFRNEDKTIKLWDLSQERIREEQRLESHDTKNIAFSRNGNFMITAGDKNSVTLWDLWDHKTEPRRHRLITVKNPEDIAEIKSILDAAEDVLAKKST